MKALWQIGISVDNIGKMRVVEHENKLKYTLQDS